MGFSPRYAARLRAVRPVKLSVTIAFTPKTFADSTACLDKNDVVSMTSPSTFTCISLSDNFVSSASFAIRDIVAIASTGYFP